MHDNGNVGINTSAPQAKLDINGDQTRGIIIRSNFPGDYWQTMTTVVNRNSTANYVVRNNATNNDVFYVYGDGKIYSAGSYIGSDSVLKQNIKPLTTALSRLNKLKGVDYELKQEAEKHVKSTLKSDKAIQRHSGFIAQDVETVFPDVVKTMIDGTKAIAYYEIIPYLVEGIKEMQNTIAQKEKLIVAQEQLNEAQQKQINLLGKQVNDLRNQIVSCCANNSDGKQKSTTETDASATTTALSAAGTTTPALLGDNTPNPFNQLTVINLGIPETAQKAQLTVYDLTGKQLKAYTIATRGQTSHTISANEFAPGMYTYALIIDNQLVASKTMVVTE